MVTGSELKLVLPETVAINEDSIDVGGPLTETEITGGSLAEVYFPMESLGAGGGDRVQYAKFGDRNTNATDSVTAYGVYIENALDGLASATTIAIVSSSASDGTAYKARITGKNALGSPVQEEVTLSGTSSVYTTLTFVGKVRVEMRDAVYGTLAVANGNLTISSASGEIGMIPAGMSTATNEFDIGLEATLDGTTTIATPMTAPAGVTFSRPRTQATRLIVDGGAGILGPGEAQGIWGRWVLPELMQPSGVIQQSIRGFGSAV